MSDKTSEAYIRPPAVAGSHGFYPSNPEILAALILNYMVKAQVIKSDPPFGLIAPHAGYVYSGPVAAWAYKQLTGHEYDTVVIIAPSHYEGFPYVSVMPDGAYETPLGRLDVNSELSEKLTTLGGYTLRASLKGHLNQGWGASEHSLEVQLPFLQSVLENFTILPVVMGTGEWEACKALGEALAEISASQRILIVASSDLSHFHSYNEAYVRDKNVINAIEAGDARSMAEGCQSSMLEACGGAPIAALMAAASKAGKDKPEILNHATSGDIPGGMKDRVVGYLSAVINP